jgi:hypothetical protein
MSIPKIGKAKYGSTKKTYYKLKDGDAQYRILPPLGELADEGIWSIYYRVIYGYTNPAQKSRAFESSLVKNRKTQMIEVPDAAVERLDKLKASLENAKAKKDKKAVDALHKLVGAPKSRYNVDSNHYMNVIDLQGNIGILKLRHKAKQALDVQIRKLRDKGVDPLSVDNGRYFNFTRTGMGNETQFAVTVYGIEKEVPEVGLVSVPVVSKLSDDVLSRLGSEAGELQKLFKKPTAEQIEQIVKESDLATGVSPNIDDILGYKKEEATATTDDSDEGQESTEAEATTEAGGSGGNGSVQTSSGDVDVTSYINNTTQQAAPTQEPKAVLHKTDGTTQTLTDKEAAAYKPIERKATTTAPQTSGEKIADMSDEEFLKSLNL